MSKQEETYSINDELIDQEVQAPVKSNKIKYAIAIITGVLIYSRSFSHISWSF